MDVILSLQNVEKLIFYDKKVQRLLPELSPIFQKWILGMRVGLNSAKKDAMLDFLNSITNDQLDRLKLHFQSAVSVQKTDPCLVKNSVVPVNGLLDYLGEFNDFNGNLSIARDGELIYICNWR